jgi:hypothetical protein
MFVPAFSSVVRQMPEYNSQRRGTALTFPKLIVLFCLLFVCKCVATVLLPPGVNPIAVNKYIYLHIYLSDEMKKNETWLITTQERDKYLKAPIGKTEKKIEVGKRGLERDIILTRI